MPTPTLCLSALLLLGLRVTAHDNLQARTTTWPVQTYQTENFTAPVLAIDGPYGTTSPGYLFFDPAGANATTFTPLIMTDTGELVWHPEHGDNISVSKQNFRVQQLKGKNVLSFWHGFSLATFGHGYGAVKILDTSYNVVEDFCPDLKLNTINGTSYACYLDQHESYITNQGTLIATAYNLTQYDLTPVGGPKNGWIWNCLFFEYDLATKKQLFSWSAIDHVPITASKEPLTFDNITFGVNQTEPWDYFHINSVAPLPDNAYLVNSRHTYSFYKVLSDGSINFTVFGGVGGEFKKDARAHFSWQHDPRILNYTDTGYQISLFDNANSEAQVAKKPTRGLYLDVNVVDKTVKTLQVFKNSSEIIYTASQGSVQQLSDGHMLQGYGQVAYIREYDQNGKTLYTTAFCSTASTALCSSYRAYKFEWSGQPDTKPKVVAKPDGAGKTAIYMSWNGAATYDNWAVSVGNTKKSLSKPVTVQKNGFETEYVVSGTPKFVQVKARSGSKVLGTSRIVPVATS